MLNYTIQVCDFMRIHTQKHEVPYIKGRIESLTGLYSKHVFPFERKYGHMVQCRDDALYLNIKEFDDMNDTICKMIIEYVDQMLDENER